MTTKTKTIEDLRQEQRDANARVQALAIEARNLPAQLKEASREDAKARAQAARSGEAVSASASDELQRLRDKQSTLPVELWAARLAHMEASIALHRAELEEVSGLAQEARVQHEAAEERLKEAQADHDAARNRHWSLATRAQNLQTQIRREGQELAQLEESPPE